MKTSGRDLKFIVNILLGILLGTLQCYSCVALQLYFICSLYCFWFTYVCSRGVGLLAVFALESLVALRRIAAVRASVALVPN